MSRNAAPARWWWLAGAAALAVAAALMIPRRETPRTSIETVRVERGEVVDELRELGVLSPRDPVLVTVPFTARLQWVVEDGTWVEPGADLFILSDEDEVKRAAELRTQLVQARAELRLAKLRRDHGAEVERPKRESAARALALAEVRRSMLATAPQGGLELVRLATELRPLAAASAAARLAAESAQDAYQRALDGYLAALDAWQGGRDRILRLQTRIDELDAAPEPRPGDAARQQPPPAEREEAAKALAAEQAAAPALAEALARARQARDQAQGPRDAAATALAQAEAAEAPLRLKAEIEKAALPLARLQLDERAAALSVETTRRELAMASAGVAAGAVAASEEERLADRLAREENDLAVIRARIAISARPPDARTLAEADARLVEARTADADAEAAFVRALALLDQDVAVKEAQVARLEAQISRRSAGFPAVLEAGIRFAQRELALLGPDEPEERAAATARLEALLRQQEESRQSPPNVRRAPVAGLVRVMRNGDRPRQAGDMSWEQDPLVEIFPPENMDVLLRVNQIDVGRLRVGQPAGIELPALGGRHLTGEVVQVSGSGRDKFERPEYAGKAGFADVVDFEARVRIAAATGVPLRQGMAARVSVPLERRSGVLRLPLAAVRRSEAGWTCQALRGGALAEAPLAGAPCGPLWFVIESGLAEGDEVALLRTRNR